MGFRKRLEPETKAYITELAAQNIANREYVDLEWVVWNLIRQLGNILITPISAKNQFGL
jgi:hypothetical protein